MKKKNLKTLKLNKKSVSNLESIKGEVGLVMETHEITCPQTIYICGPEEPKCYTKNGILSCGSICTHDPFYSLNCSQFF